MARTAAFDAHARAYDLWFEEHPFVFESELLALRHFLPQSGRGVELGIGSGRFALSLNVGVGIEPSAEMRRLARKLGLEVLDAVAEDLPFGDGSWDFVLMITTVCFLDDIPASFREARRVLKKGGSLILGLVDRESPLGQNYQKKKKKSLFYQEAGFHSTEEILSLLDQAGFHSLETVQTIFGDVGDITTAQDFSPGHGQGGFVVIRALK